MADFTSAFYQIPPVTRVILLSTAAITVPCLLQFIAPYQVALSWKAFGKDYEIWRPFTAFFFGGAGFPLIYDVFLIYRNSSALEKDTFLNDTAEYAWMHVVVGAIVLAINAFLQQPFLFRPLLHAQTYLWNRANPTMKISLFGLLTIPTSLYSPALVVLDLVTGGPDKALGGIMGILAGHVWWFCSSYLPLHAPANLKRSNPLRAPIRWKALFNDNAGRLTRTSWGGMRQGGTTSVNNSSGSATALQSRPQDRSEAVEAVRHRWGGGQKLGGSGI